MQKILKSMNITTEETVRSRLSRCRNKQHIEKANVDSPPAQSSQKWLPNMESLKITSVLKHHNNEDVWQCPECLQSVPTKIFATAERKRLEMEKNKPAEVNLGDGGRMSESERQHSPGVQPGYGTGAQMTNPKAKPRTTGVTSGGLYRAEGKRLEMEKNKPSEVKYEDAGQMSESERQHSPGVQPGYGTGAQMTNPKAKPTGVTSEDLHRAFILKVDCFTTLLLVITIGIISGLTYWNVLQRWQRKSVWFCLTAPIILWFVISCCENNCKKFPLNFILPLMITIVEGLVLGVVSSFFAAMTIMKVGGITAFVTLVLSWFAQKSKWRITHVAVPPLIVVSGLVIFGILCAFIKSPTPQLTYALLGTLIFAFFMMKTQVRIRRESTEDQEDYASLALNLYMNIVTLFFFILKLMEHVNSLAWGSQPQGPGPA